MNRTCNTDAPVDLQEDRYEPPTYPTNVPHDPALRRDRRKWGGR